MFNIFYVYILFRIIFALKQHQNIKKHLKVLSLPGYKLGETKNIQANYIEAHKQTGLLRKKWEKDFTVDRNIKTFGSISVSAITIICIYIKYIGGEPDIYLLLFPPLLQICNSLLERFEVKIPAGLQK